MTQRDRIVALVVLSVGFVVAGWFLVLAPRREQAASLADKVATQREALSSALADVQSGLAAKQSYPRDYATVARLGAAVPDDDNVPSLLLQIQQAATATHIDFRTLKTGQTSAAAVPPPTGSAPATQTATATLPPGAAVGAAGFPTMPFSFDFTGDFFHLSDFMGKLEHFLVVRNRSVSVSGRFMTLDGISFSAAPSGFPRIQASITATTYLLPTSEGLTDGATASGPASTAPDSASSGGGGTVTPTAAATPVIR